MYPIAYRPFAARLASLPLSATCADLAAVVRDYQPCEDGLRRQLLAAVEARSANVDWLQGLFALCEVLKAQNPRFSPALFMEWALEGK